MTTKENQPQAINCCYLTKLLGQVNVACPDEDGLALL